MIVCNLCKKVELEEEYQFKRCPSCKEKDLDRVRRYRDKNPEEYKSSISKQNVKRKIEGKSSDWYANNKEKVKTNTLNWSRKNPEKRASYYKKWAKDNKDNCNFRNSKRRATKVNASVKWANSFFMEEAYSLAKLRTEIFGFEWQVDHIIPLQSEIVCGLHWEQNLQVIPKTENIKKGNRYWPDMP